MDIEFDIQVRLLHVAANEHARPALQGTRRYTYAELAAEAERIARRVFAATQEDPTRPVLVLGPTDAPTMALVLGVMRACARRSRPSARACCASPLISTAAPRSSVLRGCSSS